MWQQTRSLCVPSSSAVVQPPDGVPLLFLRIHEKDGKIKSVEELLQAEILKVAGKDNTVQVSLSAIPTFLSVSMPLTTIYSLPHGIL